jgi:hypothetical protein
MVLYSGVQYAEKKDCSIGQRDEKRIKPISLKQFVYTDGKAILVGFKIKRVSEDTL